MQNLHFQGLYVHTPTRAAMSSLHNLLLAQVGESPKSAGSNTHPGTARNRVGPRAEKKHLLREDGSQVQSETAGKSRAKDGTSKVDSLLMDLIPAAC